MDATDRQIIAILQQNARTPNAEIARRIGMAPSAVFERIRKLEERGVIAGYQARLDARAVGLPLVAFVFVRTVEPPGGCDAAARLAALPSVQEVHHIAGEDCYLVKVRAADTEALGRLLREEFGAVPTIQTTRTTIVLGTIKETSELPLQAAAAEAESEAVHA